MRFVCGLGCRGVGGVGGVRDSEKEEAPGCNIRRSLHHRMKKRFQKDGPPQRERVDPLIVLQRVVIA